MSRITKPVEERRQEIIDTALKMFMENGFEKTQMADISKKMNVAAGTVYHYFKSKIELLYAVIDEIVNEKVKKKQQHFSDTKGSALDRLKILFVSSQNVEKHEEINDRFGGDPALIQYYLTKLNSAFIPLLVSIIEQGNADGSWNCEYPNDTALFITQGITGVMANWQQLKESKQEKQKRIETYMKIVFRVLGE